MNWIPVTKNLPMGRRYYFVTDWSGLVGIAGYFPDEQKFYREIHGKRGVDWERVIVTAWMPLPEPYSER